MIKIFRKSRKRLNMNNPIHSAAECGVLMIMAVFFLFSCKQKDIKPYEKRDIIKELLLGDWTVDKVVVELEVANTPLALAAKDGAIKFMEQAIMNDTKNNVLRITADKAYCYREGQIYTSNYRIDTEILTFEDSNLLDFPIPYINIYQDSLIQNKMIAYMGQNEMVNILENMGETKHLWLIKMYVNDARGSLFFKKDTERKYNDLFITE